MSLCRIRPVAPCDCVTGSRIRGLREIPAAPAGTSLEPQPWFESLRSNKVGIRPAPCIASGHANPRTRLADAARSSLFSPTLEDAMALFMVQPENFRPHDRSSLPASATAPRCVSLTVRRVTIPVHGANPSGAPKRPVVGVQPTPGLGRCVQQRRACATGVQPTAQAPPQNPAAVRRRFCHCGAVYAVTEPHGATLTRALVAIPP